VTATALVAHTSPSLASVDESYPSLAAIAAVMASAAGPLIVSAMVAVDADYLHSTRLGAAAGRRHCSRDL
jgi:hypothetical protein